MIKIIYHDSYGNLKVIAKEKVYCYRNVSPYILAKIEKFISKKMYGKVFQILRKLERGE